LYGLKTSAARFHEHLSQSLQRLGFKKNKHDPDLWMVDKSSHYEYLAIYADEILIWSKDPMAVINSFEKTYMLKSVSIPEYYLGGCCIWIIVLGRFDIAYATSAISWFNWLPREGHLKAVKRILSYLDAFPKGR
jgi:hypothetical protein